MLYILGLVLGMAVGLLRKGKLINFADIKFEKIWIILLAFTVQIVYRILGSAGFDAEGNYTVLIYGLTYAALLLAFWYNRQFLGITIIGAGSFLNALVILFNGGRMPVDGDLLRKANMTEALRALELGLDNKHIVIDGGTRLIFLSDIIPLPRYLNLFMYLVSIGDLIIVAGLFVFGLEAVMGRRFNQSLLNKKAVYSDNRANVANRINLDI